MHPQKVSHSRIAWSLARAPSFSRGAVVRRDRSASIISLWLVGCWLVRNWRASAALSRASAGCTAPSSPGALPDTRTVADAAFDYCRWVIEPETMASDETKQRALSYVQQLIVPLVGHVRLEDVDRDLEHGVCHVLHAQVEDWRPAHVWRDLLRVSRQSMTRRNHT